MLLLSTHRLELTSHCQYLSNLRKTIQYTTVRLLYKGFHILIDRNTREYLLQSSLKMDFELSLVQSVSLTLRATHAPNKGQCPCLIEI